MNGLERRDLSFVAFFFLGVGGGEENAIGGFTFDESVVVPLDVIVEGFERR